MKNLVYLNSLKRIVVPHGDVYHGIKASESSFKGFGELYFTRINYLQVKGWKKHNRLVLNLMVPVGEVRFVVFSSELTTGKPKELVLNCNLGADSNHKRLTVSPGFWVAFQGVGQDINLVANVIPEEHDPKEADNFALASVPYDWKLS